MNLNYVQSLYYSGQGIVYAGVYTDAGVLGRLVPLGNVSTLRINTTAGYREPTVSRGGVLVPADPQLLSFQATFTATLESLSNPNIAWVCGLQKSTPAVPSTGAATVLAYPGKGHMIGRKSGISAVTMPGGSALTAYSDASTPWDYQYYPETGMLVLNDGAKVDPVGLVAASTARIAATMALLPDGKQARVYVASTAGVKVGSNLLLYHAAAGLSGKTTALVPIISYTEDTIDVAYGGSWDPAFTNLYAIFDGFSLGYTAGTGVSVEVIGPRIATNIKSFLRFVGLNTAKDNEPVVIDMPLAKVKPENGIDWLNRDLATLDISGNLMPVDGVFFEQRSTPLRLAGVPVIYPDIPLSAPAPPPPPANPPPPAAPAPSPAPPPPAPAPAPIPAPGTPAPFDVGVNIHEGGTSTAQNTTIVNLLVARGLRQIRMDLYETPASPALVQDMVTKAVAAGITVQGILMTEAQSDNTIYTGGGLATWEATNYASAAVIVGTYFPLGVTDYELLNEIPLRPECQAQVPPYEAANANEATYTGQTAFISIGAALKGMADAVHAEDVSCRVILGTLGREWGFLSYMDTLGVNFDVVGYHIYPSLTSTSLLTDTWYGTGGPLAQLEAFGKPVTINEFNSGEIYLGGYGNVAGDTETEDGFESLGVHLTDLYGQTIITNLESIVMYELLDEPSKPAPENHFGLLYGLTTPKVSLYLATAFAGGTLSEAERLAITSRGILTNEEIDAMQPSGVGVLFGSRSRPYVSGVTFPSDSNTNMDNFIKAQYNGWVANLLKYTATGFGQVPAGGYYVYKSASDLTVSEGMGYGMLITVIMAGYDGDAQVKFDGLLSTVKAFPADGGMWSPTIDKLMSWRVNPDGTDGGGAWPALDGDLDIALAMLMAHAQWGSAGTYNYLADALDMIAQIKAYGFDAATGAVIGSNTLTAGRTSDYMFGHFRAFAKYTGDSFWNTAVTKQKAIIEYLQVNYAATTGLLPDWAGGVKTATPFPTTDVSDGGNAYKDQYYYNACRDPWRIATDYVLTGDADMKRFLNRMNAFFQSSTGGVVTNVINGYYLNGAGIVPPNYYWIASEFYNPMMCGAMCDPTYASWLNALWTYSKAHPETDYYGTEIQLICAIVASGNWWTP